MMPRRLRCFLPPPGLHVIPNPRIDKTVLIEVLPFRHDVLTASRNQTASSSGPAIFAVESTAAEPPIAPAELGRGAGRHRKKGKKNNGCQSRCHLSGSVQRICGSRYCLCFGAGPD